MGSFEERLEFLPRVTMEAGTELVIDVEFNGLAVGQRILQVTNMEFNGEGHSKIEFVISDIKKPNTYQKFKQIN